jgi:hypothetical protein
MCAAVAHVCRLAVAIWLVGCALVVAGCSSVKTYPNALPKNMQVIAEVDSGSAAVDTAAEFDIHRVNVRCETQYEGRVFLGNGKFDVGIPTGGLIYLEFIFASKRMLSSSVSAVRHGYLLTPRPGYRYLTKVKYLDGIYSVTIREISRDGSISRELDRIPLSACRDRH